MSNPTAEPKGPIRRWCDTDGRCYQCLRLIYIKDDSRVCIECGGRCPLVYTRQAALWRRVVRSVVDAWRGETQ